MSFTRTTVLWLAVSATITLTACSSSQPAVSSTRPPSPAKLSFDPSAPPLSFMVDPTAKTVSFRLVAAHDSSNSGFNFNGYQKGRLAIAVPEGWRVSVTCLNQGPLNHSCAIVRGVADSAPAIDGAASPNPSSGTPPGQSSTFAFTAKGQGTYRLACLVPGHQQAGMWDTFTVTGSGAPVARLQAP